MHLFADISSHGFGHLAITAPVLNALAEELPSLQLTIRSGLPIGQLHSRIHAPFTLIEESSDFGYVMIDATKVDLAASATAYRTAHADWPGKVNEEAAFLSRLKPDLVLTNVSYLPLAGAAQACIPAISFCSLNWADLFSHFFRQENWAADIHAEILAAYRSARAFLRITPGMPMDDLDNLRSIGPIALIGKQHDLKLNGDKAVLITMGGIAHRLPIEGWPRLPGLRLLLPAGWQCRHPDAVATEDFGLSFTDLLCSVDAVITKPGYGTFTEAACNGTPVIYQRRDDWPEQEALITWLQAQGICQEISGHTLQTGDIRDSLRTVWETAPKIRPSTCGIGEAARTICSIMGSSPDSC